MPLQDYRHGLVIVTLHLEIGHPAVALSGFDPGMPQEILDGHQGPVGIKELGGHVITQLVARHLEPRLGALSSIAVKYPGSWGQGSQFFCKKYAVRLILCTNPCRFMLPFSSFINSATKKGELSRDKARLALCLTHKGSSILCHLPVLLGHVLSPNPVSKKTGSTSPVVLNSASILKHRVLEIIRRPTPEGQPSKGGSA
jgi:hypothetical protein